MKRIQTMIMLFYMWCGFLNEDPEDMYGKQTFKEWQYLKVKYQLEPLNECPSFYQHRPDNFPTIRLAQLAALYHHHHHIFETVIQTKDPKQLLKIFQAPMSEYWASHYHFDKPRRSRILHVSAVFGMSICINTILPFLYVYQQAHGQFNYEKILLWLEILSPEKKHYIETMGIIRAF